VRAELDQGTGPAHYAVAVAWLRVVPLSGALDPLAAATLDAGEAAVLQLAREQGIDRYDDALVSRLARGAG
jgi:hypothetical protein